MNASNPAVLVTTPTLGFLEPMLSDGYASVRLWEQPDEASIPGVRALTCLGNEDITPVVRRMPDLKLVACFTTGYDAIDLELCETLGIAVTHGPDVTARAVAEHALALTLALARNVLAGSLQIRSGEWQPGNILIGRSLEQTQVGVVGLGNIGTVFAGYAQALGADVSWWGPRPKADATWPRASSLLDLAKASDVLVVCARAEASNRHLISAEILSAMPAHARLVNVARGQLVDEDVLIRFLCEGRLAGAALDVFEVEPTPAAKWREVPNVVLTPHIGGATQQSVKSLTAILRDNLDRFFSGTPLATPVTQIPDRRGATA